MNENREYYHKFRHIFYPDGKRDEEAFKTLCEIIADGYTDEQIARFFGVSRITVGNWKREHPEIRKCFDDNLSTPDDGVERSLYERARGYTTVETKLNVVDGVLVRTEVLKQYPPDTTAGIFWLTNRRPSKWKSTTHIKSEEVAPPPAYDYSKLTEEQQDELERLLANITPPKGGG